DGQGRVVVRLTNLTLKLAVPSFPVDRLATVTWQWDDRAPQEFAEPEEDTWAADLSKLAWPRGNHRVRVVLRTLEDEPQTFTQDLNVRYAPPAPTVTTALPTRQVVDRPEYTLAAEVQPQIPGETVRVQLVQRLQDKDVVARELKRGLRDKTPLT